MLNGCKELKDGSYQLCVQFFNLDRIAISNEMCKEFKVETAKAEDFSAPTLINPENGKAFTQAEMKRPLTFRWTPVVPRPRDPVTYKLSIWQLQQGQNGMQAMRTNQPIIIKDVENLTQSVERWIIPPCGHEPCNAIWQVEAFIKDAATGQKKSLGVSAPKTFSVLPDKTASPCSITVTQVTSCHGKMPTTGYPTYATIPTIVNSTGQNITSWTVSTTGATLLNALTPTDPLPCFPFVINTGTTTAGAIIFMSPAVIPVNLTYTFTLNDGSTCVVIVPIVYTPCAPTTVCTCLPWPGNINYGLSNDGGAVTSTGTIVNGGTITTNDFLSFTGLTAPCNTTPCTSFIRYWLYKPDGTLIFSMQPFFNSGTLWEQPCSNAGKYKIVIKAQCGSTVCSDFVIFVDKPCPPCNTTLAFTTSPDTCTAKKGTVRVVASGGTAPYTYSWSTVPAQTTANATGLSGGTTYTVTVTDAVGCIQTGSIFIPLISSIINLSEIPICIPGTANGNIVLTVSGGIAPYTYLWSNSATSKDILNVPSGPYGVTLTDANGCKATGSYSVTCPPTCDCQTSGCTFNKNFIIQNPAGGALNPLCSSTIGLQCNTNYRFDIAYNCTNPNCKPIIKVEIKDATPVVVSLGTAPLTYSFTTSGTYTITYYLIINGKVCSTCTGKIEVKCKPDCCKGSYWKEGPNIYNTAGTVVQTLNCQQPQPFLINAANHNCNETFTVSGVFVCGSPGCTSTVKYTLTNTSGSISTSATNVITIPATLPNDNYTLLVEAYCDGHLCSTCKFEIKKDCPNPGNCNCGQWGPIKVGNNIFKCGDKIKWNCNTVFNFSTTYTCSPNTGNCMATINWKVEKGGVVKTGTSGGTLTDFFTPTTTGDYVVTLEATCNGIKCPPGIFTVHVENCPPPVIDCCKGSSWGDKVVIDKNGVSKPLPKCGTDLGLLECGAVKKLNICYNCNPNCKNTTAQIKYEILDAVTNAPYSGFTALQVASCTNVNIALPVISGSWYLKITTICDIHHCDSCNYYFQTKCQPNPVDCCKGSYWKEQPKIYNAAGVPVETVSCPQPTFSFLIKNGGANCNETYTIKNGVYVCANANCVSRVDYSLVNTATNAVVFSGTNSISITPTLPNGNYVMNVYAICGTDTCSRCTFQIKKDCPPYPKPCCQGGKWLTKYYSISAPLIKTMPMAVDCDGNYDIDFIAGGTITFNADYLCNPALGSCTKQLFVSVKKLGTSFSVYQPVSYSMPLNEAGTYNVCYYAKCGTDICDSCCFTIKINEKKDCCKGSYWINKSIDWSNDLIKMPAAKAAPIPSGPITMPATSINITDCNVGYKLSLGGTYTFNADYNCALKDCPKNVKVKIKGLTYSGLDGIYTAPIAKTFTEPGNYMISYLAYCGDSLCVRCDFTIGFDKNCCLNSKWNSANYQIVNKKPDSSWIWEPGIFPIGSSIPTLKADLGIDISALDFQCAKGCTPQYIIRRINQSTGAFAEPDETLAVGQTTASIYAKPFPQLIIITPTCDGQKCTPLMFRVECLHKDCVPSPCSTTNLIISTGISSSGTATASGLADDYWHGSNPLKILSPGTSPFVGGTGTGGSGTILQSVVSIAGISLYKIERDFYVCNNGIINFSGILGISTGEFGSNWAYLFNNFNIYKSGVPVWSYTSGSPGVTGTYVTNNYSGSLAVTPGKYTFVFEYKKASKSWNYNSVFVSGKITGNVLANNEGCCPVSIGNTGHGNPTDSIGEVGHIGDLPLAEDTCGTWGNLYYYNGGETLNAHIMNNDTVYSQSGNMVYWNIGYTCYNPSCPLVIERHYFVSSGCCTTTTDFLGSTGNSSGFEGKVELTATCCGKICGKKIFYTKLTYPAAKSVKPDNNIQVGGTKMTKADSGIELQDVTSPISLSDKVSFLENPEMKVVCEQNSYVPSKVALIYKLKKDSKGNLFAMPSSLFGIDIPIDSIANSTLGCRPPCAQIGIAGKCGGFCYRLLDPHDYPSTGAINVGSFNDKPKLTTLKTDSLYKYKEVIVSNNKHYDITTTGKLSIASPVNSSFYCMGYIKGYGYIAIDKRYVGSCKESINFLDSLYQSYSVRCPLGFTFTPEGCVANEDLNPSNKRTRVKCNCGTDIYGKDAAACTKICDFLGGGSATTKGPIKFFNYEKDFVIDAPEICTDLGLKSITIKKGIYEVSRINANVGGKIELQLKTPILGQNIKNKLARHFDGINPKGLNCEGPGNPCFYKSGNASAAKVQGFTLTPIIINGVCLTLVIQYDKGSDPAQADF